MEANNLVKCRLISTVERSGTTALRLACIAMVAKSLSN